jgi:hypothetical protein
MRVPLKPIPAALIFAAMIIASAYFLKGNPAREWVNAIIYGMGAYYWFRYLTVRDKRCRV